MTTFRLLCVGECMVRVWMPACTLFYLNVFQSVYTCAHMGSECILKELVTVSRGIRQTCDAVVVLNSCLVDQKTVSLFSDFERYSIWPFGIKKGKELISHLKNALYWVEWFFTFNSICLSTDTIIESVRALHTVLTVLRYYRQLYIYFLPVFSRVNGWDRNPWFRSDIYILSLRVVSFFLCKPVFSLTGNPDMLYMKND